MNTYTYSPHPHNTKRKHPIETSSEALSLNEKIGLRITTKVGTMETAYIFFCLALVSLPAALASQNVIVIVGWVAQTFLQLVLLPIIIVGQNIQAKKSEKRAIATYEDAGAILDEAKEIQKHMEAQDVLLSKILAKVSKLENL